MALKFFHNNPSEYWFKRRQFGWGWIPARLPGWVVLIIFLGYATWCATVFDKLNEPTSAETYWYLGKLTLGVVALIAICFMTGESPRWQWGSRRK